MFPRWVNVQDRLPELRRSYFTLIDNRKDICRIEELRHFKEKYPERTILWLEECDPLAPVHRNGTSFLPRG